MQDLFGARLVDHAAVSEVTLKVVEPFGDLKPGDIFRYSAPTSDFKHWAAILEVQGGKVIAVDQDNRPALVANVRGAGKTLLCAYPVESYLAETPSAFEKPESTYGIYKAFLDWAGVKVLFRTDQPSVEVSALRADRRGYAVLVSHSAVALPVTVTTSLSVKSLRLITPRGPQAISLEGKSWKMVLTPYEGAIVEWDLAGM